MPCPFSACWGWSLQTHLSLMGLSLAGNPRLPLLSEGLTRPHSQGASLQPAMPPANTLCSYLELFILSRTRRPVCADTFVLLHLCPGCSLCLIGYASHLPQVCNIFSFLQGLAQISNLCSSPFTNPHQNKQFLPIHRFPVWVTLL